VGSASPLQPVSLVQPVSLGCRPDRLEIDVSAKASKHRISRPSSSEMKLSAVSLDIRPPGERTSCLKATVDCGIQQYAFRKGVKDSWVRSSTVVALSRSCETVFRIDGESSRAFAQLLISILGKCIYLYGIHIPSNLRRLVEIRPEFPIPRYQYSCASSDTGVWSVKMEPCFAVSTADRNALRLSFGIIHIFLETSVRLVFPGENDWVLLDKSCYHRSILVDTGLRRQILADDCFLPTTSRSYF